MEVEIKKSAIEVGYETEKEVLRILRGFDCVTSARIDRHRSKIDLYYTLKGEEFTRCLQVKTIYHSENRPKDYSFSLCSDGYEKGMLLVILKWESDPKMGLVHFYDRSDGFGTKSISLKQSSKANYKAVNWTEFLCQLENSLPHGLITTKDFVKRSMIHSHYLSYQSHERFQEFADGHGLQIIWEDNPLSKTDLYLNGYKVKIMYSGSKQKNQNSYGFKLGYTNQKNKAKFEKNDNDFYVCEIGEHHGDFLFLPEYLLIDEDTGMIKTNFSVFPYDYLEKMVSEPFSEPHGNKVGNFTRNKKYWISSENGCFGSNYEVDTHIENLYENSEEEIIEMEIF